MEPTGRNSYSVFLFLLVIVPSIAAAGTQCRSLFDRTSARDVVAGGVAVRDAVVGGVALRDAVIKPHSSSKPPALSTAALDYRIAGMHTVKGKYGPVLIYHHRPDAGAKRRADTNNLTISTFNPNTLREFKTTDEPKFVESEKRRHANNGKTIRAYDPDIQLLMEVDSAKTLDEFNKNHLQGLYVPFLIPSRDAYGKSSGMLMRKNCNLAVEFRSHAHFGRFTHDAPVALFYDINPSGTRAARPKFAILISYLKSSYGSADRSMSGDKSWNDPAVATRRNEVETTGNLLNMLHQEFGKDLPIIVGGDFNGSLHENAEFKPLFDMGYQDFFDLAPHPKPVIDRGTHVGYVAGKITRTQIDGFLGSGKGLNVLAAAVVPQKNANGQANPLPQTKDDVKQMNSDHLPVVTKIEFVR